MKLKLVKMIKNFVKILELLRDRLEVCVSVCILTAEYAVKPVLSDHSKKKTNYRLMQVKSIAECSKGSIRQYFRPAISYHLL